MKYKKLVFFAVLSVLVFFIAYSLFFGKNSKSAEVEKNSMAQPEGLSGKQSTSLVVVSIVSKSIVNDKLTAIGTGRAHASVELNLRGAGRILKFHVVAGSKVERKDIIAELDSDKERIALAKAQVDLNDMKLALDRATQLRKSNTATQVQMLNAQLALETAKLELEDADLALKRRTIRAPIGGIVGILPVDAGNYVPVNTKIAHIDDRSFIQVDVWVPERFAPLIKLGDKIIASSIARPGENYEGKVSAIDNMIDATSRTLRVRAQIDNKDDKLLAGQSFQVSFNFPGDTFPSVDPLAIQWNNSGAFVWRINGDKAEAVPVFIVQRNMNNVLVNGALKPDELIVIQGLQNLRQGTSVRIKNIANADTSLPLGQSSIQEDVKP